MYIEVIADGTNKLQNRELWASFLELLVISILIDRPSEVNLAYVKNLLKCRRLIYIDSEKSWKQHVKGIFCLEHKDLRDNAVYIVRTNMASNTAIYKSEQLKKLVTNISFPVDGKSISNSITNVTANRSLVDIKALHNKCIQGKEDDYSSFCISNVGELNEKLADEYGVYLIDKVVYDEL